jgi:photosystem II stability/assembly factor-like uncharacterized protein
MIPRLRVLLATLVALSLATAARADVSFFNAVFSRDALDVLAVGDSGLVYRSFDGGANWTRFALGDKPLRGVIAIGWTIVAVGDSGKVWRSVDSGGGWALQVMSGTPSLRAIASLGGDVLVAVGSGGTVLRSNDAGASWGPEPGGTGEQLNAVQFVDTLTGWVAGTNGFLARSTNGGASWTPVVLPTTQPLNSVAARGTSVWVVGDNATVFRSTDGGANFALVNLHADASPDVKKVWLSSPDSIYMTGGGGFIRRSFDGGAKWTFLTHTIQGQFSDLYFVGASGWAAGRQVRTVMRTTDRGNTWLQPSGSAPLRTWNSRLGIPTTVRGNTFQINARNKRCLYVAAGRTVYRSRDEGETWTAASIIPPSTLSKINAFVVSAKDTNRWIAAVGAPDHVVLSVDGGATWSDATNSYHDFGEYGVPLEMDPDHPDTLYFGIDNGPLYWSTDGGASFNPYSNTIFRSPCDIVVVPESDSALILVGDGITGSGQGNFYRAANHSLNFTNQATISGSEIPSMATSRLRNGTAFGTNWSSGGVERSVNGGLTWPSVHSASSSWGVDVARDDPSEVIFGVYSGSLSYTSYSSGDNGTFSTASLPGSNYAFLLRDRGLSLALQSGGVYKLAVSQNLPFSLTQSLTVTAPNGGESWAAGSVHDITWSAANVALARIEYRAHPADAWQQVSLADGYRGRYTWSVPYDATTEAAIRVSDAWDGAPIDASNQTFVIPLALIAELPGSLDFGSHPIGAATLDTVRVTNTGTGTLIVSSITAASGSYQVGRSSLSLAPGASDTVGVTFTPNAAGSHPDTLVLVSNAYNAGVLRVPLAGIGADSLMLVLGSPNGGEAWQYGTTHLIHWQSALVTAVDIAYQVSPAGSWISIADSVPADASYSLAAGRGAQAYRRIATISSSSGAYPWLIPNAPSTKCRLRVQQHGGAAEDISQSQFSIIVPAYVEAPSSLDLGVVSVGLAASDTIHIQNPGTAPLTISSVTSSDPHFWPGRSSLVIPPGSSDSLAIGYRPTVAGPDTATIMLVADDPLTPHTVHVSGSGVLTVAVGDDAAPSEFALGQNQPNPFTTGTLIHYALPIAGQVDLEVFDLRGNRVATLVNGAQGPGAYRVPFGAGAVDARGQRLGRVPPGIYFYRLRAGGFSATRKMVLMR